MARRSTLHGAALVALLTSGALAHPRGDLGLTNPAYVNRVESGQVRADGVPPSSFNKTDEEVEMDNRIWRFLTAPRAKAWSIIVPVSQHRPLIAFGPAAGPAYDLYYRWLHRTPYRSASVRYATLAADIEADLETIPATFESICSVQDVDHQREVAEANLPALGPDTVANVAARVAENEDRIAWFASALRYRYESYSYALDHLLVETPDPGARSIDEILAELGDRVSDAERHAFCLEALPLPEIGNPDPGPVIPSRYSRGNPDDPVGPRAGS